jgi:HSP20 family molecular chaperone IbpA
LITRRAFEIFEGRGGEPGRDTEDWFRAESEMVHPAPLNVMESDAECVVRAEVPGLRGTDIKVDVRLRSLVISGERQRREIGNNGRRICAEWCADRILRSVVFNGDVDAAKVTARGRNPHGRASESACSERHRVAHSGAAIQN